MRKFLGMSLAVGALVILAGAAVAQMEHGSGHDMHGAMGQAGKAGHHEMMKSHMSKAGHEMNCPMGQAGHEMTSPMGNADHDMKSHAGESGRE